jgi:hypothetical protein
MPEPTPYTPSFDFTASDKGPELNVQLADVSEATTQIVAALADIRRSDGALQNGIVTADSFGPGALAVLGPNGDLTTAALATAQNAASAATTAAGTATTQAGVSTTQAGIATTQAGIAATQAGIATTQAGIATAAATPVAFSAHRNGTDQTGIVSDTATKVTLATEVFDQGGFYASSAWTPSSGRYRLTACAMFTAGVVDGEQFRAMIYKNGALFRQAVTVARGTGAQSVLVTCSDAANGTDFYEFFVQGAGAGAKTISGAAANTWFEGSAL